MEERMIHNLIICLLVLVTFTGCNMRGLRWNRNKNQQIPVTKPVSQSGGEISAEKVDIPDSPTSPGQPVAQTSVTGDVHESQPVAVDSKVVAASILQVNGQFITVHDIVSGAQDAFGSIPPELPEQEYRSLAEQIVRAQVHSQISHALVLAEALARLTDPQEGYVDREMERIFREMVAQAGGSEQALHQQLAQDGILLDEALDEYRNSLVVQIYLQQKLYPEIVVTRGMLWDAYLRDRPKYIAGKKMQMQIISVGFDADAGNPDSRKRIDEASVAIDGGEDFAQVAKRLSDGPKASVGGIWPLMAADNFRYEQVEQAAFTLELGQVSEVIETDKAFFIVKAYRIEPAKTVSFEEAQDDISVQLREQMYLKLTGEHFEKLARAATIVESEKIIETAVDFAMEKFHQSKP